MKKKIICFLSVILIITFCIALSACDDDDLLNDTADDYFKNVNMPLVYEIYLDYMEEIGETPLTYEEWFAAVHGDEFQKGILPEIRKNDLTDFWEISYNNGKGWNDLRFKTETEEQKNCKHSFDKWIILCEGNDYCSGIRYRNCKNCNYKDYQFKLNDNVCLHLELETIAGTPATCVSEGLTDSQKCAKCGEIVVAQETLSKLNHIYNDEYDAVCNVCGYERDAECPHSELEIIPGNTATCSKIGLTDGKKCVKCGEMVVEQEMIGKLDHTIVIDSAVESTCTSTGLTEGRHCSVCKEILLAQKKTPFKDHTFENWICQNCGMKYYSDGLKYTLNDDGKSYSVTDIGSCKDIDIIISAVYNGKPVTNIGDYTFAGCSSLTSIVIPDRVTSIGVSAFSGCSSLTSIEIPDSVTSIGEFAFYGCSSLESITIPFVGAAPNGTLNTHFGYIFGASTFVNNSSYVPKSLKYVIISGGSNIYLDAFWNCSSLTSIVITNGVTKIWDDAFYGCSSLKSIVIPDSVTSIDSAFHYCTSLENITVQQGNTVYHSAGNCLIETASKTLILGCKNSVIPADGSITSIGKGAFSTSTTLNITIPDSVTNIGYGAFWYCRNLTSITIPNSITSIGDKAFYGCSDIESITVEEGNTVYHSAGNCLIETASKRLILGCKNSVIPTDSSVTSIGNDAFYECSGLTSIVIPNSIISIGSDAFSGCSNLTNINIPNSVTSIGYAALSYCSNLTSIVIPDSVTSIGNYAFYKCSSLTSIEFGGIKAQWDTISKGSYWNYDTGNYTVHCIDGDITK